ncbi:choice-of-anchor X domain-containing protein [Sandaracinus amylolyticus]|uniref:choice-of-anchor X domain-containing protein n=1 Tax=Sandaracinus amylolyticus TaxID=927083 RepID=UPI001F1E195B|nr:choice-of-anchor X domain-containing protein [Sandaracinus amylolyticus]UJR87036.1 Hypothetical protein I5071_91370 [Sandaracinus amylolyticus]
MMRRWAVLIAGLALAACGDESEPDDLAASCDGERVLECDPYEYTAIASASVTPERIGPLDPTARATVHVELEACDMRPGAASVQLFALIAPADAGADEVRVVDLGLTVRDDGTNGDETANDGVIDQTVGNPFGREIPERSDITLRFVPVLQGCQGDPLELAYPTGTRFEI